MLRQDPNTHAPNGAYWVCLGESQVLPTLKVLYRFGGDIKRQHLDSRFATVSTHNRERCNFELYLHDRQQKIICSTLGEAVVLANSIFSLTPQESNHESN